jgi:hypothetical protein
MYETGSARLWRQLIPEMSVRRNFRALDQKEVVIETIATMSLELQMIFNKGSLMILPAGVTKATGLNTALERLRISRHNVVGIGDAENDHSFLSACECGVAVANALPSLKERADLVTTGSHSRGVIEIIEGLLGDDLASVDLARHNLMLGTLEDGAELRVPAFGTNLLVAGPSGAGKSTLMTGAIERLVGAGYQICVLDPEGDYQQFPKSVILGDAKNDPPINRVLQALEQPDHSVFVNLLGVALENRPDYVERLLPRLAEMQAQAGRPHWLVMDEMHHLAPTERVQPGIPEIKGLLGATLDPKCVNSVLLRKMSGLIAVGESVGKTVRTFAEALSVRGPDLGLLRLDKGEAVLWWKEAQAPTRFQIAPSETPRTRHSRKYAEAMLTPDRSFYFRGPEQKLNLRASNLITFVQMMDGVDDETFAYHLSGHEYSQWFRENIKNPELAQAAEEIENASMAVPDAKAAIKGAIEERYTLPG